MKDLTRVIVRPVVTEKTTDMGESQKSVFEVATAANKIEIKQAVEQYFGVKVTGVRTMNVKGKPKRQGRFEGKRPDWKKAWVVLKKDAKMIEFFEQA